MVSFRRLVSEIKILFRLIKHRNEHKFSNYHKISMIRTTETNNSIMLKRD